MKKKPGLQVGGVLYFSRKFTTVNCDNYPSTLAYGSPTRGPTLDEARYWFPDLSLTNPFRKNSPSAETCVPNKIYELRCLSCHRRGCQLVGLIHNVVQRTYLLPGIQYIITTVYNITYIPVYGELRSSPYKTVHPTLAKARSFRRKKQQWSCQLLLSTLVKTMSRRAPAPLVYCILYITKYNVCWLVTDVRARGACSDVNVRYV